jgi:hypothetical protein
MKRAFTEAIFRIADTLTIKLRRDPKHAPRTLSGSAELRNDIIYGLDWTTKAEVIESCEYEAARCVAVVARMGGDLLAVVLIDEGAMHTPFYTRVWLLDATKLDDELSLLPTSWSLRELAERIAPAIVAAFHRSMSSASSWVRETDPRADMLGLAQDKAPEPNPVSKRYRTTGPRGV